MSGKKEKQVKFAAEKNEKELLTDDDKTKIKNNQNNDHTYLQQQIQSSNNLKTNIFVFTVAILLGMLIQQGYIHLNQSSSSKMNTYDSNFETVANKVEKTETNIDLNQLFKEMSENLKREILETLKNNQEPKAEDTTVKQETEKKEPAIVEPENKQQVIVEPENKVPQNKNPVKIDEKIVSKDDEDVIINDDVEVPLKKEINTEKKTIIDFKLQEDENLVTFGQSNEPIILDTTNMKFKIKNSENDEEEKRRKDEEKRRKDEEEGLRREKEERLKREKAQEAEMKKQKQKEEERERKRREEMEEKERRVLEDKERSLKLKQEQEKLKNQKSKKEKEPTQSEIPDEIKNFKSKKISQIKPKKMWIPIPNR